MRVTPESLRSALASFERAIELDPGYALAHAWLGMTRYFLTNAFYLVPDRKGMPKAKSAAHRALGLDDALPEAHSVFGYLAMFEWDWPLSELHLRRALEFNPSLSLAHGAYAWHLLSRGRVLEMDPTFWVAHALFAQAYEALGRYEEAIAAAEKAGLLIPEQASERRSALSQGGAQGYWRATLPIARSRPVVQHLRLASIHAQLGERDEAFAELERAYAAREGDLVWLRTFPPGPDPIRDDARFDELVRRIGIPES